MPRRNFGTLLENIVLVETVRQLLQNTEEGTFEFVNSFVMPPLACWGDTPTNDKSLSPRLISSMAEQNPYQTAYPQLMRQAFQYNQLKGPSGSLLCALILKQRGIQGRYWLNDLPDDDENLRYKHERFGLSDVEEVACRITNAPSEDYVLRGRVCRFKKVSGDVLIRPLRNRLTPVARLRFQTLRPPGR